MARVERRVEPVERDVTRGVGGPDAPSDRDAQAKGRMHRHRDRDQLGPPHALGIEWLDRHVHHRRRIALALEKGRRPRDGQRLVAELVARDEQDRARLLHVEECTAALRAAELWWYLDGRCSTSQGGLTRWPSRSRPGRTVRIWSRASASWSIRPELRSTRRARRESRSAAAASPATSRCATARTTRSASRPRRPRRSRLTPVWCRARRRSAGPNRPAGRDRVASWARR